MSEYVRSVTVHVEVDTNKSKHTMRLDDLGVTEIQTRIAEFVDAIEAMIS